MPDTSLPVLNSSLSVPAVGQRPLPDLSMPVPAVGQPQLPVPDSPLPVPALELQLSLPEPSLPVHRTEPQMPLAEPSLPVHHNPPRPNRRNFVPPTSRGAPVDNPNHDELPSEHMRCLSDRRINAADRVRARDVRLNQEWEGFTDASRGHLFDE